MEAAGPAGGPALAEALEVLASTCGVPPDSDWLAAAVRAGVAEGARIPAVTASSTAVAEVTTWVLPAAACALVMTRGVHTDAAAAMDEGLRDVAAALMVVRAPLGSALPDEPPGEGLLLGHALAAGWLATQLWEAGVVGVPRSFERTVAAVVGAP
ncbi:MAG: hypothetical protein ABJA74_08290 [Lapillicoccus sp.]